MKILKKIFFAILKTLKWVLILLILLLGLSAIYNQFLPEQSDTVDTLSKNQKAYIAEAMWLQSQLGDEVWPGWSRYSIPVIVYNEKYAFLVGMMAPEDGWKKMPVGELCGGKWEVVDSDDFFGEPYYRQHLPDAEITPENFTVKVGDQWVATMQTREYAEIAFYNGFKKELPAGINAVFPYEIFWNLVMGHSENYITGLVHESFHSVQGIRVSERLASAENINHVESSYPWLNPENEKGWMQEVEILLQAQKSESQSEIAILAKRFLEIRKNRRSASKLTPEQILYEKEREWLEGLAKYAELKIGLVAAENTNYIPKTELEMDSDFVHYQSFENYFLSQVEETKWAAARSGESRFYYGGMLQAVLLDRLHPGWKEHAFNEGIYLEDLLKSYSQEYASLKYILFQRLDS